MERLVFLFLMLFAPGVAAAQTDSLSPLHRKWDVEVFKAALLEAHPGLDIYLSQAEIDSLFEALKANTAKLELKDFYTSLLRTVSALGDGHTELGEGKRFREAYPYLEHTLPFEFCIIDRKIYLAKSYTESMEVPAYTQVLSINGKTSAEILQRLYALTPADGGNMGFKEAYNEKILGRQLAKLIGHTDEYRLVLKQPDGAAKAIKAEAVHDSIIHPTGYNKVPLAFELNKEQGYAILTVNTFQYGLIMDAGQDYHAFLRQSFKALRKNKIEHLIIDLRENYGGNNILAITLYSYLASGTFTAMSPSLTKLCHQISVALFSSVPDGSYPIKQIHKLEAYDKDYCLVKDAIDSKEAYDSDYIYKGPGQKVEDISRNKFGGKVYCLTSGITFSAAANLSAMLRRDERAIFIGQETGGAYGTFCGGGFYTVTLPHSGFVLQIPFMRRSVARVDAEQGRGIIPDYPIQRNVEHIKNAEDKALAKAVALIKASR